MTEAPVALPKLAFIHVIKAGGTTFREILRTLYGNSFHFCTDPTIPSIQAKLAKYRAVEFHKLTTPTSNLYIHCDLIGQRRWDLLADRHIFTMFRDPLDHYLSYYHYVAQRRAAIEPMLGEGRYRFPQSLEEFMSWKYTFNQQLASFVGKLGDDGYCCTREDLETAKEMLVQLHIRVGLTENFAGSMHIFEIATGLQIPGRLIVNQNSNPNRQAYQTIPEDVKQDIRRNSALDQELYDFGRQLFLRDLALCGPMPVYCFAAENATKTAPERPTSPQGILSRLRAALPQAMQEN
jgi:hypothetical protein